MEKITKREMYRALITLATEGTLPDTVSMEDVETFAAHEIELLDNRTAKEAERRAAKAAEPDELKDAVAAVLTSEPMTIADIMVALGDTETTAGKISARLTKLAKEGFVTKEDVKVPTGEGNKTRTVKAYKRA